MSRILDTAQSDVIDGSMLVGIAIVRRCTYAYTLFAGNRAHEFLMKTQGKSYSDIAKEGGGIPHTQGSTKAASEQELD
jgi:hypothetical protein